MEGKQKLSFVSKFFKFPTLWSWLTSARLPWKKGERRSNWGMRFAHKRVGLDSLHPLSLSLLLSPCFHSPLPPPPTSSFVSFLFPPPPSTPSPSFLPPGWGRKAPLTASPGGRDQSLSNVNVLPDKFLQVFVKVWGESRDCAFPASSQQRCCCSCCVRL